MSRKRLLLTLLKLAFGLLLLGWLYHAGRLDLAPLRRLADAPAFLAAGLVLMALVPLFSSLRWCVLVRAQGIDLSPLLALRLTLIAFFFNTFLPGATGGDLVKAWYIARQEEQKTAAVTTILFDRLVGTVSMFGLAAVVLLIHLGEVRREPELAALLGFAGGGMLLALATAAFFFSVRLRGFRERLLTRLAGPGAGAPAGLPSVASAKEGAAGESTAPRSWRGRLAGILQYADAALHLYRGKPRAIAIGLLLSLTLQVCAVAAIYCYGRALAGDAGAFGRYLFLVPLALVVNGVPLAPMGLGQGEAAFSFLFERFGPAALGPAARSVGGALFFAFRLGMLLPGLAGFVCYVLHRVERRKAAPADGGGESAA